MSHCSGVANIKALREAARCNGYPLVRVLSRGKAPISPSWQNGEANELLLEVTPGDENNGTIK